MFYKIDILKNFAKSIRKQENKKRLWHRCLPVNVAKFLRDNCQNWYSLYIRGAFRILLDIDDGENVYYFYKNVLSDTVCRCSSK